LIDAGCDIILQIGSSSYQEEAQMVPYPFKAQRLESEVVLDLLERSAASEFAGSMATGTRAPAADRAAAWRRPAWRQPAPASR
jgi:hypothetical protein